MTDQFAQFIRTPMSSSRVPRMAVMSGGGSEVGVAFPEGETIEITVADSGGADLVVETYDKDGATVTRFIPAAVWAVQPAQAIRVKRILATGDGGTTTAASVFLKF